MATTWPATYYTPEQVGSMTPAELAREAQGIMTQLLRGLAAVLPAVNTLEVAVADLVDAPPAGTAVEFNYSATAAGNNGTFDVNTALPTRGVILLAFMDVTAGTSNNYSAILYDGDPANGGTMVGNIFGSAFVGANVGDRKTGPFFSGTTTTPTPLPYEAADPWIRFMNAAFSETESTAALQLHVLEV